MSQPKSILETSLYVDDLDAAERFYTTVLNLKCVSREEGRHLFFACGEDMLLLFLPEATCRADAEVPPHGATGPGHVAFAVQEEEMDWWRKHLQRHGVAIEKEIRWPQGGRSLYFRDPAGNSLELTTPKIWKYWKES